MNVVGEEGETAAPSQEEPMDVVAATDAGAGSAKSNPQQQQQQQPSSEDEMDLEIFKHPLKNPRDAVDYWNHSLEKVGLFSMRTVCGVLFLSNFTAEASKEVYDDS